MKPGSDYLVSKPDSAQTDDRCIQLLDDAPQTIDKSDAARLGEVETQLRAQLVELTREQRNKQRTGRATRLVGLFGGLGQGKSSLVLTLLDNLRKQHQYKGLLFNVSDYKAADLEFELDRILASYSPGRHFRWLPLLVIVLLLVLTPANGIPLPLLPDAWETKALAFLTGVLGLIGGLYRRPFTFLRRRTERHWWTSTGLRHVWKRLRSGQLWLRQPDLLVVDDLDRAAVPQQRAILRSLFKLDMPLTILIAMDETALRQSDPDPESPEEFLRKHVPVRMKIPNRVQEDTIFLVFQLTMALRERNQQAADNGKQGAQVVVSLLNQPGCIAAICQVVSLLPEPGPRRIKRLLNNWALRCAQSNIRDPEDAGALLRLSGLTELCPPLRAEHERFIELLRNNDTTELEAFWQKSKLKPDSLALRFFASSRGLRPRQRSWSALIGYEGNPDKPLPDSYQQAAYSADEVYTRIRRYRQSMYAIAKGFGMTEAMNELKTSHLPNAYTASLQADTQVIWPTVETALANIRRPERRERIYQYWQRRAEKVFGLYRNKAAQAEGGDKLLFMLYRRWLADTAVVQAMSLPARLALVEVVQCQIPAEATWLLTLIPGELLPFHIRVAQISLIPLHHETLRSHSVFRRWLSPIDPELEGRDEVDKARQIWSHRRGWPNLVAIWPPIEATDQISLHFAWLRQLWPPDDPPPPAILDQFLSHGWVEWCQQSPQQVSQAVLALLYTPESADQPEHWQVPDWLPNLMQQQGVPDTFFSAYQQYVLAYLVSNAWQDSRRWFAALLWCCGDKTGGLLAYLLDNTAPLPTIREAALFGALVRLGQHNPLWSVSLERLDRLVGYSARTCDEHTLLEQFDHALSARDDYLSARDRLLPAEAIFTPLP